MDFVLYNLQRFICHKTQTKNKKAIDPEFDIIASNLF